MEPCATSELREYLHEVYRIEHPKEDKQARASRSAWKQMEKRERKALTQAAPSHMPREPPPAYAPGFPRPEYTSARHAPSTRQAKRTPQLPEQAYIPKELVRAGRPSAKARNPDGSGLPLQAMPKTSRKQSQRRPPWGPSRSRRQRQNVRGWGPDLEKGLKRRDPQDSGTESASSSDDSDVVDPVHCSMEPGSESVSKSRGRSTLRSLKPQGRNLSKKPRSRHASSSARDHSRVRQHGYI